MKGFNKNDFVIDKVFDKLSKVKKKSSHKKDKNDELSRPDFDKECANDLIGSTEVHGPIKIDIVM